MEWAVRFFNTVPPRKLLAFDPRSPLRLFTDAALEGEEDDVATIGAVMFDEGVVEQFGLKLTRRQLASLQMDSKKIISSLEALPVAASLRHWKGRMLHRIIFIFVDNDAARAGLIKLQSDVPAIRRVHLKLVETLSETPCFPWYARVPTKSNVADNASRLERLDFVEEQARKVYPFIGDFFKARRGESTHALWRKTKGISGQDEMG